MEKDARKLKIGIQHLDNFLDTVLKTYGTFPHSVHRPQLWIKWGQKSFSGEKFVNSGRKHKISHIKKLSSLNFPQKRYFNFHPGVPYKRYKMAYKLTLFFQALYNTGFTEREAVFWASSSFHAASRTVWILTEQPTDSLPLQLSSSRIPPHPPRYLTSEISIFCVIMAQNDSITWPFFELNTYPKLDPGTRGGIFNAPKLNFDIIFTLIQ